MDRWRERRNERIERLRKRRRGGKREGETNIGKGG